LGGETVYRCENRLFSSTTHGLLKISFFVSGHRFSDAECVLNLDTPLGAGIPN
jgi:hypothetical protein